MAQQEEDTKKLTPDELSFIVDALQAYWTDAGCKLMEPQRNGEWERKVLTEIQTKSKELMDKIQKM